MQSETTIHALPKSLSPVKAEPASDSLVDATHACITPKSTPFKCAPKPLPSSGTKRKSTSAEGTPKSKCRVDNLTERDALPPMLRAPLNKRMPETVLSELTNLWSKKPPLLHIQNVLFAHKDTHRLLRATGRSAYLNDVCFDFFVELLNRNQAASFSFGSYLYTKYNGPDQVHAGRYVRRHIFVFEDNKGKYVFPEFIFLPMLQGLHWTLLILKPHDHNLIYLDPLHPNKKLTDAEKETAWLFGSWVASELPTLDAGKLTVLDCFETQMPRQTDGVSCGMFVLVYTMMFSRCTLKGMIAENILTYRWRMLKCFIDKSFEEFFGEFWKSS